MNFQHKPIAIVGLAALAVSVAACSSNDTSSSSDTTTTAAMATSSPATTGTMAAGPVGPGCADYAAQVPTGPGSVAGMANEPLSVAAANNPMLTTLTAAVSGQLNPEVNLTGTLDGGEYTVFAPVDSAFAKIDPATLESLKTDSQTLTAILTYHVVPGQLSPADVDGTHPTVQGATVTVTGSGDDLKVDNAAVICGGVRTENSTVYLIDTVLMPPA